MLIFNWIGYLDAKLIFCFWHCSIIFITKPIYQCSIIQYSIHDIKVRFLRLWNFICWNYFNCFKREKFKCSSFMHQLCHVSPGPLSAVTFPPRNRSYFLPGNRSYLLPGNRSYSSLGTEVIFSLGTEIISSLGTEVISPWEQKLFFPWEQKLFSPWEQKLFLPWEQKLFLRGKWEQKLFPT